MAEDGEGPFSRSVTPYFSPRATALSAAEVEQALLDLYGMAPGRIQIPAFTEQQITEWQERWEELTQDPALRRLRILGESDEDLDRREWESSVRRKLDSALFALANGWPYEWNQPYEYDIAAAPRFYNYPTS